MDHELSSPEEVHAWLKSRTRLWIEQGFDPLDWIYQSWAYDGHDVGNSAGFEGDTTAALCSIKARSLIVVPPLDLYNPAPAGRWAADQIHGSSSARMPRLNLVFLWISLKK